MKLTSKMDHKFRWMIATIQLLIMTFMMLVIILDKTLTVAGIWSITICTLVVMGVIYWMAFSITYELREDYLYVRAGFLFTKVRYEHIESYRELSGFMDVFTGFNLLSSTDGLAIMSQKIVLGEVKISPVEKERFIQELEKKMVKREV